VSKAILGAAFIEKPWKAIDECNGSAGIRTECKGRVVGVEDVGIVVGKKCRPIGL
jgi:hypothetical protein